LEKYIQDSYDSENRLKDIVNEADKLLAILQSEVVKAIKGMRRKKATGDDNTPVDLLKEMGDSGLKIMTALVNKIYMSGHWPKDSLDVTVIALPNKNQTNWSNQRTISVISHIEKTVARILSKRLERRVEEVIEEEQFGFWKGTSKISKRIFTVLIGSNCWKCLETLELTGEKFD
jgi:Reverse transcriptase (RNA-dependent DNA polymerase).